MLRYDAETMQWNEIYLTKGELTDNDIPAGSVAVIVDQPPTNKKSNKNKDSRYAFIGSVNSPGVLMCQSPTF